MAVYTALSYGEIAQHLSNYSIGDLIRFEPAKSGIENTNYIVTTTSERFVLTIFEDRTPKEDLPFIIAFMEHLQAFDIPVASVIPARTGEKILLLKGKASVLVSFLKGNPSMTPDQNECALMGSNLGRLHLAAQSFKQNRVNPVGLQSIHSAILALENQENHPFQSEIKLARNTYNELIKMSAPSIPIGVIHADLFPDNIFFDDAKISGIIDFYFSCSGSFILDLAITLNAWAQEKVGKFCPHRANAFLQTYQQVRPLSSDEKSGLPYMFRFASLRFLTTRLFDWTKPQDTAVVEKKNPLEYAEILNYHLVKDTWAHYENS